MFHTALHPSCAVAGSEAPMKNAPTTLGTGTLGTGVDLYFLSNQIQNNSTPVLRVALEGAVNSGAARSSMKRVLRTTFIGETRASHARPAGAILPLASLLAHASGWR
jgi:hypothetical protein